MSVEFEPVIGLEVHAQLATESKIFCGCKTKGGDGQNVAETSVNSNTCPVCAGHPGTLPVLNKKVVEYAIKAGLATHCEINLKNIFARKNYFYPDLPKGYQISQYDAPICEHGWLEITTESGNKKISLTRIHMEEDAGKNVHHSGFSLVNLNRAGVPLIEIVSGPDLSSAEEAGAYLRSLHGIVTYLGICDGNMQEGNFRCDANVSIRPKGSKELGTRAEIKNVNSFRFVEKAIEYEISRQIEVVSSGGKVVQETRNYDSTKGVTVSLRSKEEAHDYRYFPDPDLIPLKIDPAWIEKIRSILPELPEQKKTRFAQSFGLSLYDASVLTSSKSLAEFFEATLKEGLKEVPKEHENSMAKAVANFLTGEVSRLINEEGKGIEKSSLKPSHIAGVVMLTQKNTISSTAAKQVIGIAWKTGKSVESIVAQEGFVQVSDAHALEGIIEKVIASHPAQVAQYRSGKDKLLGFFVGQAMKESSGKANPTVLQDLFKKKLKET